MKVIKETSIKLTKECVGQLVIDYLTSKGLKSGAISFDLVVTEEGAKFLGVTITTAEMTEI
jgi:hypothetical protein